jgi:toxin ParE1/3/4
MSRRRVTITARARTDVAQAKLWYASIDTALADDFLKDIDETFEKIRERPESFPQLERDVRRAVCDRFPYKVYFAAKPKEVRVLAVYHVSRNPRRWRR